MSTLWMIFKEDKRKKSYIVDNFFYFNAEHLFGLDQPDPICILLMYDEGIVN